MLTRIAGLMLLFFVTVTSSVGQEIVSLTLEQRQRALSRITDSESFKSATPGKRVLCEVTAKNAAVDGNNGVVVTTYHFNYDDGSTLRSTTNLETGATESVRLEGYSPPLSPEERIKALQIAVENISEMRTLYERQQNPKIYFLPSVVADPESELFGHRVVEIQHAEGTRLARKSAFVDLTSEAVLNPGLQGQVAADSETLPPPPATQTVEHSFPLNAPEAQKQTAWKVTFGIERHGAGEIPFIKEAHFQRGVTGVPPVSKRAPLVDSHRVNLGADGAVPFPA